jgi:hypothetical protein
MFATSGMQANPTAALAKPIQANGTGRNFSPSAASPAKHELATSQRIADLLKCNGVEEQMERRSAR